MEDDDELAALRERRLAQMKQQFAGKGPQGPQDAGQAQANAQEAAERKNKEEDIRNTILASALTQEARARLSTLEAAKPEKAKMVENIIIQNVRMGSIQGKIDDEQFKGLLSRVSEQTTRQTKVKYDRRRAAVDDDSDEEDGGYKKSAYDEDDD